MKFEKIERSVVYQYQEDEEEDPILFIATKLGEDQHKILYEDGSKDVLVEDEATFVSKVKKAPKVKVFRKYLKKDKDESEDNEDNEDNEDEAKPKKEKL